MIPNINFWLLILPLLLPPPLSTHMLTGMYIHIHTFTHTHAPEIVFQVSSHKVFLKSHLQKVSGSENYLIFLSKILLYAIFLKQGKGEI